MGSRRKKSGRIVPGTVYRFIGVPGQYLLGVPARDLIAADVLEVQEREGITEEAIVASMLYEPVEWEEVGPFCGVDGCREKVAEWGKRCENHRLR